MVTLEAWLKKVFSIATFDVKMFIFNVYKNLFDTCNSFSLLQKMLVFVWYDDGNSAVIMCS